MNHRLLSSVSNSVVYKKYFGVTFAKRLDFAQVVTYIRNKYKVQIYSGFDKENELWFIKGPNKAEIVTTIYPELREFEPIKRPPIAYASSFDGHQAALSILQSEGFLINDIELTNHWKRVATRDKPRSQNGSYCFYANNDNTYILVYRNWAKHLSGIEKVLIKPSKKDLPKIDQATFLKYKAYELNIKSIKESDEALAKQVSLFSFKSSFRKDKDNKRLIPLEHVQSLPEGFYALKKRIDLNYIQGCYIANNSDQNSKLFLSHLDLVIPIYNYQDLTTPITIQSISLEHKKKFYPGINPHFGVFPIYSKFHVNKPKSKIVDKPDVFICEGLATAASIMEMLDYLYSKGLYNSLNSVVLATFSIHNLEKVAKALKGEHNLIICADNDHSKAGTLNVGKTVGSRVAQEVEAKLLLPEFPPNLFRNNQELTDWNDFFNRIRDKNGNFKNLGEEVLLEYFWRSNNANT